MAAAAVGAGEGVVGEREEEGAENLGEESGVGEEGTEGVGN